MRATRKARSLPAFSGEFIRLLVGLIAFFLPVLVWLAALFAPLTSISASYYTPGRNVFVGLLFVLGGFLLVYKGRGKAEAWIARVGALAPIVAALFPTKPDGTVDDDVISYTHLAAGAALFLIAAYFCLGPFRQAAKEKSGDKAMRRERFYIICGSGILAFILIVVVTKIPPVEAWLDWPYVTFVAEWIMLWLFGLAWMVAAKVFPWFTTEEERISVRQELAPTTADTPAP